ncbi:MAG: ParB/RepB/Spo0J family partition protein [Steroidobacteraceae bacterium]
MSAAGKSLGRGLQSLLSGSPRPIERAISTLPLEVIQAGPSQPRVAMQPELLEELAASIRSKGVIQPIVVRPRTDAASGEPTHEIVAGERRWRAAKIAGLTDIPVVIRELGDQEAVAIALIENVQREELTPAEEARALARLVSEFELTHLEVAQAVGRSRAAVSNLLRLLELPEDVLRLVDARSLSMGHARALLGATAEADRSRMAAQVVERGLSVRETETLVRKHATPQATSAPRHPPLTVVSELRRNPQMRVMLHQQGDGSGRLVVEFKDGTTKARLVEAIDALFAGSP